MPLNCPRPSPGSPFCELPYAFAVGVGNNEEPASEMPASHACAREHSPFRIVPAIGQAPENSWEHSLSLVDVLHDDDKGSHLVNDPDVVPPEPRPVPLEPRPFAGAREILAGVAAAEDVDGLEGADSGVFDEEAVSVDVGPVLAEDLAAVRVGLDLPPDTAVRDRSFEAKLKTSDAAEETAN